MSGVPPSASEHPATGRFDYPIYHAETRAQLRAWLAAHHATVRGVWLCSWRSGTGRPACPYPEVVEEAICFGWIDSTAGRLDDERGLQLLTPRRARSTWTRLNRRRAADMEAAGLMTDAGRRAVGAARANGWWTILDPVEDLLEPADLAAALDAVPAARATWDSFPAGARKAMLWWVLSAARPETRAGRVAQVVDGARRGERARG
ncbi:YdeI/OmpD-associated family protein [Nocardioides sp. 31GB23]|uniref:YdeI/OmpD-associated family protein n=1 Tax=Nocardioides sp. 31GB23 TaxID=3156065 RepID=UPI0032B0224E